MLFDPLDLRAARAALQLTTQSIQLLRGADCEYFYASIPQVLDVTRNSQGAGGPLREKAKADPLDDTRDDEKFGLNTHEKVGILADAEEFMELNPGGADFCRSAQIFAANGRCCAIGGVTRGARY